jgi:hypothetical protein
MPIRHGGLWACFRFPERISDRLDPLAFNADLANDFTPSDKVTDHRIKNPYRLDLRAGGPHTTLRTPPMFNPPREPISKKHCFR